MNAWPGPGEPQIQLLGACRLGTGSHAARLLYHKSWALLAYIAVERGQVHRRSDLAELLWPELERRAALINLRQVLSDLNRAMLTAIGEGVLLIGRETVALCPLASGGLFDIDLIRDRNPGAKPSAQGWMLEAGRLIEGLEPDRCEQYCQWLATTRTRMQQLLVDAIAHARDRAWDSVGPAHALPLAKRLVEFDPWDELRIRELMQLYVTLKQPEAALACYRTLLDSLARELGVEPQPQTHRLAEQIAPLLRAAPDRRSWRSIPSKPAPANA